MEVRVDAIMERDRNLIEEGIRVCDNAMESEECDVNFVDGL